MHENLADDMVVTWDKIVNAATSAPINPTDGINLWLITVVLSAIACFLLLLVNIVKYCMKRKLTINSYHHINVETSRVKEISIKNDTHYCFHDMINNKCLWSE